MTGRRPRVGPEWRAAYRVQLRPDFDFRAATALLDYLVELGVSHLYCSPIAEAGSDHGYDVVDPTRIRRALGGREGFEHLAAAAHERGLGLLVDVVPNHMAMGADRAGNSWWWDVLEHGRASPHAAAFDIVWDEGPGGRLLLPLLDDHLRRVIESGRLTIERADDHALHLRYADHHFPLAPRSITGLLRRAAARTGDALVPVLAQLLDDIDDDPDRRNDIDRVTAALRGHLNASPPLVDALDAVLDETNHDHASIERIGRAQHYRLARWQLANREITYRRFFDVTELVALRTDLPPVFDETHALVIELVREGAISGLRIDHPDGLRDPEAYLERLSERTDGVPVWVEKILSPGEPLQSSWPVAGTTGYDFSDLAGRLFIDTEGALALRDWFVERAREPHDFDTEARVSKHTVLEGLLAADVDRVATLAVRSLDDAGWDVSTREMRVAVSELAVALPVYRTYVRPRRPADARDLALLTPAAHDVARRRTDLDRDVVDALVTTMLHATTSAAIELVARFQQLCASATAKGIEDTAFYRWAPVVSLAEVGSHPDGHGVEPDDFHRGILELAEQWPHRMLETSTHDSKRAEDVRARISALTEISREWITAADRICTLARSHMGDDVERDPAIEIIALETLVGAWPLDADRLVAYLLKAAREAKRCTSWLDPDHAYETALEKWARALVDEPALRDDIEAIARPLVWPGRITSLASVVLKTTAPGVAGIYQGNELWDDSLVDPDNRRTVDFDERRRIVRAAGGIDATTAREREADGSLKLWVLRRVLAARARRPVELDGAAPYVPLDVTGARQRHVVAFRRGDDFVTVVPRLNMTVERAGGWDRTAVQLPAGRWRDLLGDRREHEGAAAVHELLEPVPVTLLERVK